MTRATQELLDIVQSLPEEKQVEVADFARFLVAKQADEVWERTLASGKPLPRLDDFLRQSAAEGDESLDPGRL
jgi:hypothetical protein